MTEGQAHRRIVLLAPMRSELQPVVRRLGLQRSVAGGTGVFSGRVGSLEIVATTAGIGTQAAALSAQRILDQGPVYLLVVVGIAGGIGPDVAIGDLVVPELVIDLATGKEYHPTPVGATEPRGILATSDELLITAAEVAGLEGRGVVAVDMETSAIAAVCDRRRCPWSVFRGISDRPGDGLVDPAVLSLTGPEGEPKIAALVQFVLAHPRRIPHLARLGRGLSLATRTAADAVREACAALAETSAL
jgi:adenosylhomocysteine nucleosidase